MRKQNGITLLALVITIIVLLVLAAVTINTIVSDDGLIRKSQEAKFKMEATTYKEREREIVKSGEIPEGQTKEGENVYELIQRLRSQIRELNQGSTNAQDGISLIEVATGGLSETHEILQEMNELVIQVINNTNTEDINVINDKLQQHKEEIDRISTTTMFNNIKLLDGTAQVEIQLGGANTEQGVILIKIDNMCWNSIYGEDEIDSTSSKTLEKIQNAIEKVSEQRLKLGTKQNRLEHTINYLDNLSENITALEASISDTDMKEAMEKYENGDKNAIEELSSGYASRENAIKNANSWGTTLGFVQTAEGTLSEIHSMLQRLRGLSVQAANSTTDKNGRNSIQIETNELIDEINRELNCCIVSNKNLLQGDLQYIDKIDINKLGIKDISVQTQKDAIKATKSIEDAINYISEVRTKLGNRTNSLELISGTKADEGYAFDVVDNGKGAEVLENNVDEKINDKFVIEGGILYYIGTDELEKKWAEELNIAIK